MHRDLLDVGAVDRNVHPQVDCIGLPRRDYKGALRRGRSGVVVAYVADSLSIPIRLLQASGEIPLAYSPTISYSAATAMLLRPAGAIRRSAEI